MIVSHLCCRRISIKQVFSLPSVVAHHFFLTHTHLSHIAQRRMLSRVAWRGGPVNSFARMVLYVDSYHCTMFRLVQTSTKRGMAPGIADVGCGHSSHFALFSQMPVRSKRSTQRAAGCASGECRESWDCDLHWIRLRENLQETWGNHGLYHQILRFLSIFPQTNPMMPGW